MNVAVIIGIVAFLILLFIFYLKQEDKEHILLRLLAIIIFFNLLVIMAKSTVYDCELVGNYTNNVYVYGSNFTGYHWDYDYDLNPAQSPDYDLFHVKEYPTYNLACSEIPNQNGLMFYKLMNRIYIFMWLYIMFFIAYKFLQFKGIIPGVKKE